MSYLSNDFYDLFEASFNYQKLLVCAEFMKSFELFDKIQTVTIYFSLCESGL